MKVCYSIETKVVACFAAMLFCVASVGAKADDYVSDVVASPVFEQNKGQIIDAWRNRCDNVFFKAEINGATVFFTNEGVTFSFVSVEQSEYMQIKMGIKENPYTPEEWKELTRKYNSGNYNDEFKPKVQSAVLQIQFPGADLTKAQGEDKNLETRNYFTPEFPDGLYGVPTFKKVRYSNVYPNVDLLFYIEGGLLKYDFELLPNANLADIKLLFANQKSISLDEKGNVVFEAGNVKMCDHTPKCYQDGKLLDSRFYLDNDTIKFAVDGYDSTKGMVIDPVLTWSTYFHDGNSNVSLGSYATRPLWDSHGNMFIVTSSGSNAFPLENPGSPAYYQSSAASWMVEIMKFNTNKEIVWSTYYGGDYWTTTPSGNQSAVIDKNDNLYLALVDNHGTTPLYNPGNGAYYEIVMNNGRDVILEFNTSTCERLWATGFAAEDPYAYASGSGLDITAMAIDENNNLVITGHTYKPANNSWTSIPLRNPGSGHYYNSSPVESQVSFLARFNGTNHALNWSTYISRGGSGAYVGSTTRVAIDSENNIYLTSAYCAYGAAFSGITLSGAYNNTTIPSSGSRISQYKFNASGTMIWATLFGSTNANNEFCYDSGVDENNNLIIIGATQGTDFYTKNPGGGAYYKSTLSVAGKLDGFISKFSSSGSVLWSTYIGGTGTTTESTLNPLYSMALDANNNIYVSGYTRSTSYPLVNMSGSYYQSTYTGDKAVTVSMFNANGVMKWSTYYGNNTEIGTGGFNCRKLCGDKLVRLGFVLNSNSIPLANTNGYEYYNSTTEGTNSYSNTDFIAEFAMTGVLPELDLSVVDDEYCLNESVTLPTTINGIAGTWSPSTVATNAVVTDAPYVFTPTNTCYLPETLPVDVINCCTELAQPTLTVTNQTDRSVTVSWNSVPHASSYTLYYGVNDPNGSTDVWQQTGITGTTYTIPELTNGQPYNFAVMPVGSDPYCPENDLSPTRVGTPVCE